MPAFIICQPVMWLILPVCSFVESEQKNVYENDAVFSYLSHYLYNISKGYTSSEHMTNIDLVEFPLRICDVRGNLTIFKSYTKTTITWWYIMLCA